MDLCLRINQVWVSVRHMGDEVGRSGRNDRGNDPLQDDVGDLSCAGEPVSACGADCGVYLPLLGAISQYLLLY